MSYSGLASGMNREHDPSRKTGDLKMEMTAKVTIRGMKRWVGVMEGKSLDTGKIFVDVELKGEDNRGCCTEEIKCSNSKVVEAIAHNPFPFLAEITLDMVSSGKEMTQICTAITPLKALEKPTERKAA
jgi:hypothetical protein